MKVIKRKIRIEINTQTNKQSRQDQIHTLIGLKNKLRSKSKLNKANKTGIKEEKKQVKKTK